MNPSRLVSCCPRLCLVVLAGIMLLPGLDSLPLVDRDEPRFAHATVEMIYRDEWVIPYFNGEYRFDKPPLTYWWMRAHFAIFGINEFGARLHSVVSSLLCALLVFGFARRLGCDASRSFLAAGGWLTCLQVLIHSRMAVADMPLILFLILTMRALWELQQRDPARPFGKLFSDPWFYVLGLSMGGGFLAKGPLAQFIPLLAVLLWAGLNRLHKRPSPNFTRLLLAFLASAPIWFGMIAAWGIPALLATKGAFYDVGIGRHVVERGTSSFNSRLFIPGVYYLVVVIPFLLPWSPRLPEVLKSGWKASDQAGPFLLAWLLSPFLIFSFYATQLPHYILPGYPAFFLLLFLHSGESCRGRLARTVRVLSCVIPAAGAVFLLLCSTLVPGEGDIAILRPLLLLAGCSLLVLAIATLFTWRGRYGATLLAAVLGMLIAFPLARTARRAHVTIRLQEALAGRPLDGRVAWKFKEPSLVWYFDDGQDFQWTFWPDSIPRPASGDVVMVLEYRRWRIDGESASAIARREASIPPTKERFDTPAYQEAVAELTSDGRAWEEVHVAGWSPATTSWIEVVALVPRKDTP